MVIKQQLEKPMLTARELKTKINGANDLDFFAVADNLISKYAGQNKVGTVAKTKSIVKKLREYVKSTSLHFKDISPEFLERYERYLRNTLHNKTNTVCKDLKFLRRVFNEAYRHGITELSQNPFLRYKIHSEKSVRTYLTQDELTTIENIHLPSKRLELVRDMFVFSSYTGGIRISDLLQLRVNNFDGVHIHFVIRKTGNQLSIKVPLKGLTILDKYKAGKNVNDFIFPILHEGLDSSNYIQVDGAISSGTAKVNKCLKTIAVLARISKPLSFHIARHTWGTIALRKGMSLDKVSKLMGHASVRETQVYAKIMSEELDRAMDIFND